jgi:polycomb protein EED
MPRSPKGFQLRGALKESHGHPIYGIAWSPHTHVDRSKVGDTAERVISYFATCAGPCAAIYEVVAENSSSNGKGKESSRVHVPSVRQSYRDVDDEETFYTCAFGGRGVGSPVGYEPVGVVMDEHTEIAKDDDATISKTKIVYFGTGKDDANTSDSDDEVSASKRQKSNAAADCNPFLFPFSPTQDGPPLLCLAGTRGIIKVIDTVRRSLFLTLSGHGDEITDLQFSPTNEWLLLSASYDESIRLWNLQRGTNVAVFTGHDGHRRQVLSVAWHFSGKEFASCGMDNTIKLWNVMDDYDPNGTVQAAIVGSNNVTPNDYPKIKSGEVKPANVESKFKPIFQQTPYFSTNKVHTDYVDCIQFIGDLILSKSVHNKVVLWKPLLDSNDNLNDFGSATNTINDTESAESSPRIPSAILFLREFSLSHCDSWFVRFHSPPPFHRLLALGNQKGEVKVWQIGGEKGCHPDQKYFCSLPTSIGGFRGSSNSDGGASTVRMVRFNADASCLVAVCDDATVWMWEAC